MSFVGKQRVLVLNQDYSPIGLCNVEKAFILVYLNKAEMVSSANGYHLRSVEKHFPMPAVVRLNRYVHVPYKGVLLTRQNVFKRDGHECQYCGSKKDLTLDHLIPRSKGGKTNWTNLITACKRCNALKGDNPPEKVGLKVKKAPFKPNYVMFIRDFSGFAQEEWKPFLKSKEKSLM